MYLFIKNGYSFLKNRKNLLKISISLLMFMVIVPLLVSCMFTGSLNVGKTVTEDRQVSGINSITTGSGINLIIEQSGKEYVKIEAPEKVIPYITTEVTNGELRIELKPLSFISIKPVNCYVGVNNLSSIKVSSSASIKCENLQVENLSIEMASSSKGSLNIAVKNLDLLISSSANLTVSGQADSENITVNSSGRLDAFGLIAKECKITVNSSGTANIGVTEKLDAIVNSSANLNYKGDPVVNSEVSSSGNIRRAGSL
jgi:hypothetical protein